jgi:hypothetical protein
MPARIGLTIALAVLLACCAAAQPPGPPPPPPPPHGPRDVQRRMAEIHARLESARPADTEQRELAAFAERYLGEAKEAARNHHMFLADRFTDAADACVRPFDHLAQMKRGRVPAPPQDAVSGHLRQVYFRLRLSDFFMKQLPEPRPYTLLEVARRFYQQALDAMQSGQSSRADIYATCTDDLTHALESLAQAYAPAPPPPPLPPRPPQ